MGDGEAFADATTAGLRYFAGTRSSGGLAVQPPAHYE